ncbi:MAG: hypothetical protein KJ915_09730 [Candidatus Omnitrophica bacterium]|nr:hypothetical protein [Candidatus Omnitrophota bacterium]
MDKKCLNKKGLSLVEVVLSALLLTVVVAALLATYRNASNLMGLARNKLIALNWAESIIERERSDCRNAYIDPADTAANRNYLIDEKAALAPVITRINHGAPQVHLQEIKVTINWTE